ncbi:MAG TPA: ATP-dependent RecD-like DNA helicase [Planctomycetes bacterium]|nr:ATP-dependent RecD-like DNA helicase [Planctomycetota bacterium]
MGLEAQAKRGKSIARQSPRRKTPLEIQASPCQDPPVAPSSRDAAGERAKAADPAPEITLQGTVERVTYSDEKTLYTVLKIAPDPGYVIPSDGSGYRPARCTAVGRVSAPGVGLRVSLSGSWQQHKTHGPQFAFEAYEVLPPIGTSGLVKYLSSKTFHGVGETLAGRIVKKLGANTLETIRDDANCLDGIRGLRPEVAQELAEQVAVELGSHQAHAFLRGLDLGPWQTSAIIASLGVHAEDLVRRDPYQLAGRVRGLGFGTADRVAMALGIARDDPRRARAGLLYALSEGADDGHSLLPRARLLSAASVLLSEAITPAALETALEDLHQRGDVVIDVANDPEQSPSADAVYQPRLEYCEAMLARNLTELLALGASRPLASPEELSDAEARSGLELNLDQRAAVLGLLASPVGLLTGGPGVGKTTIVRLIVSLAEAAGARVLMASPTGRAAKRMAEATGRDATTVHRMLGFNPKAEGSFEHDRKNPLEADLIIVDEISMLDLVLAHHLVKAIAAPARLVLVGDPDQLPAVGPGNVLADMLSSEVIPTFRLRQIYRQAKNSRIVRNAHRLLEGLLPDLPAKGDTEADFYFFASEDPDQAAARVLEVVCKRIPMSFGFDWHTDVQVISPMYRGPCGVDALNEALRDAQGTGTLEISRESQSWRVGDRVIHTRNDYEREVFNGDMGRITRVDAESGATVAFPDREVIYTLGELSDLRLAFAITVHRAQGAEFPVVVLPLATAHYMMLQRNLLYTAITRAQKLVVLVGSRRALHMATNNTEQSRRESALDTRLQRALEESPE